MFDQRTKYTLKPGALEIEYQKKLIFRSISHWKRRGHRLLQVGTQYGYFSDFLWESGFDLTCVEERPWVFDISKKHSSFRIDWQTAAFDHLPFDDNEFDYGIVFLGTSKINCENIISELIRICNKAVLICFYSLRLPGCTCLAKMNWLLGRDIRRKSSSRSFEKEKINRQILEDKIGIGAVSGKMGHYRSIASQAEQDIARYNYWAIRKSVLFCADHPQIKAGSVLAGPRWTWSKRGLLWSILNGRIVFPGMGGYVALHANLKRETLITPIALWKTAPKPSMSN